MFVFFNAFPGKGSSHLKEVFVRTLWRITIHMYLKQRWSAAITKAVLLPVYDRKVLDGIKSLKAKNVW